MLVLVRPTKELKGKIKISGSKNSCLPIMAISLLTNKKMTLTNVPLISDIYDMIKILEKIGVKINVYPDKNKITLKRKKIKKNLLIDEITKIRASYYVIPGMIAKHNEIKIKYPGGCNFMERPIDYHIDALKKAGAKVFEQEKNMIITKDELRKNIYSFEKPSVGATINAIMLSVMSKGKSKIINQPIEPEINDFIKCLKSMGANIIINNNEITIIGGKKLDSVVYEIMPDRIELGSYILLGSSTNSEIELSNIRFDSINYLIPYLNNLGINYQIEKSNTEKIKILIKGKSIINNIDIIIKHYPSFPTDLQQILSSLLLKANKKSIIEDKVYKKRISHIKELNKMNAKIEYQNEKIHIYPSTLKGTNLYASDLRCGFSLILAAINATGESTIDNFQIINRGYEDIISKLKNIKVQIEILKK